MLPTIVPLFAEMAAQGRDPWPAWLTAAVEAGADSWLCLAPGTCPACGEPTRYAFVAVTGGAGPHPVAIASTCEDRAFDDPIAEELQAWLEEQPGQLAAGPFFSRSYQACSVCGESLPDFTHEAATAAFPEISAAYRRALEPNDIVLRYADLHALNPEG